MRLFLEVDGPVLDVRPTYGEAYQQTVREMGLGRIDSATFWRLTRTGAPDRELLRGSKPRHWEAYRERFDALLESDAIAARLKLMDGAIDATRAIAARHALTLVTLHENCDPRRRMLENAGIDLERTPLLHLSGGLSDRAARLRSAGGDQVGNVAVASGERFARTGTEASFRVLGVANGPCTPKRLVQTGATKTFADLPSFAHHLEELPNRT